MIDLDHQGFFVAGKVELRMLMTALFRGFHDVFPIEILYGQWKNTEGQVSSALQQMGVYWLLIYPAVKGKVCWLIVSILSSCTWISQALKNPDVMCLADFHKATVQLDMLKTAPDEENRDICTWKSLGLVEALLRTQ